MAGNGIRAIIFDIGRVLVRIDLRHVKEALADGLSLTTEELWSAIEKDPLWMDWQRGRVSPRDWHLNLCKRLGVKMPFDRFVQAWNSVLDPKPIHPDSLFASLSKKYRLALLSNTDPIHVPYLESTYSFYHYFPAPVRNYSCSLGACKPDPLVFRQALESCKVAAPQAIYIDDIGAFADAAQSLGMHGVPYTSPEQLRSEFQRLGITVE
jgi:putative hydrolase of the HAD superfamily